MNKSEEEAYIKILDKVYNKHPKKTQVSGSEEIEDRTIKYNVVRNHGNVTVVLEDKGNNHVFIKRDDGWERLCAVQNPPAK